MTTTDLWILLKAIGMGLLVYLTSFTLVAVASNTRWQAWALVVAILLVCMFGGYIIWLIQTTPFTAPCEVCRP